MKDIRQALAHTPIKISKNAHYVQGTLFADNSKEYGVGHDVKDGKFYFNDAKQYECFAKHGKDWDNIIPPDAIVYGVVIIATVDTDDEDKKHHLGRIIATSEVEEEVAKFAGMEYCQFYGVPWTGKVEVERIELTQLE